MDMNLRPATAAEQLYAQAQSMQIAGQCGGPGVLRGGPEGIAPVGRWRYDLQDPGAPEFQAECRAALALFREQNGGEEIFRADGARDTYLIRRTADGCAAIYPYRRDWMERHRKEAEQGIRFITPRYREKFRIPDGDMVRILCPDGRVLDRVCRYVDSCHVEVGNGLYHICEFAERMERNGNSVIPLRSSLPERCFGVAEATGEIVVLIKGELGYRPAGARPEGVSLQAGADALNEAMGVTKAQAAAMLAGSLFGWDTPAADPKNYSELGQPIRPRHRDRGDAR